MEELDSRLHISEISSSDTGESWQIIYVSKGEARVTLNNKVYELKSNTALFVAPQDFCFLKAMPSAEYMTLWFKATGGQLYDLQGTAAQVGQEQELLLTAVCDLLESREDTVSSHKMCSMLELFVILCCENIIDLPVSKVKNATLFSKAADILKKNVTSQISAPDLAEYLNISLSHLKRLFSEYTNIGVHEYFIFLKIAAAKEFLKSGKTVTATAELTGFANQAYFSAAFKRVTGLTPKEYYINVKPFEKKMVTPRKKQPKDLPSYLL